MAYLKELLSGVVSNLLRNKLRSALTMAGIAWGVASIVIIVAMGDGFKLGQRDRLKELGENIVVVYGGRTELQPGGRRAGRNIRLAYTDVRDIRAQCYLVRNVVAELQTPVNTASSYNSGVFTVNGVEPEYSEIRNIPVARGRFLAAAENDAGARAAVIGDTVRKQLFGERRVEPGAQITLKGLPYRIVGIMPPKDQSSTYNGLDSEKIYIPYSAMARDLPPPADPNFHSGSIADLIYVPASVKQWKSAREQVTHVLARNHDFDPRDTGALSVWDTVENAELVDGIFTSMTAFLGIIAVVTLTLGGVGVMNIMLVSVTERTREIGLRKAVGATSRRILADFLAEGTILAFASGLVGWLGASGLAAAVNQLPKQDMFGGLPVSAATSWIAFAALGIVAVLSAVWPAWRAASLAPAEALRYER